ncbi:hypothetical protein [Haemophilus parahaemolyticus]|uniref:hypothetical protein n=1 Tax=Haemophilus parahaemolyticus TaxID=735 RepID=UPI0028EE62B2|nr:hypothetical protein [Haemophilus parahaemolyticus]
MTTEMNTPYELFAYQVGQDMKGLTDRVEKLEGTSVPTMTQTRPLAVVTVSIAPQDRVENREKLGNGDYIRDESHISGTIQLDSKYAGLAYVMFEGNRPLLNSGTVNSNGAIEFYSNEMTYRQATIFLFSPEQATSQIYFDAIENPKKKGVIFTAQPELRISQNEYGTISDITLFGLGQNGSYEERYLEYGKDKLKVTVYEKSGSGEHTYEAINTYEGNSFEYHRFMTDIEGYELVDTHIQGYTLDGMVKKIVFEIETKEGFHIEKEEVNRAYWGD